MNKQSKTYQYYLNMLQEELISATGCTEPIAVAFAAAKAKDVLGVLPDRIDIKASDSVIKNAKSVLVPNTPGLRGIEAAAAVGVIAGDASRSLDVIREVSPKQQAAITQYLKNTPITLTPMDSEFILDVEVTVYHEKDIAQVRIINDHTNIVHIEKNTTIILEKDYLKEAIPDDDRIALNIKSIVDFAEVVAIDDVKDIFDTMIKNNMAIAEEGLAQKYGANIGSVLLKAYGNDVHNRAKAKAAAASDARMGGSKLPVTIVSGSGNQGISASIPVIEYARELGVSQERLYRALAISTLVTLHQKRSIGRLSAYCGVVFSGAGSGAGIAYLHGGSYETIAHTIVNALAIIAGMICDGAKASCAAKISAAVDAGILGYHMYAEGQEFLDGEGIIAKGIENTIENVSRLARDGMRLTNKEILDIMTRSKP